MNQFASVFFLSQLIFGAGFWNLTAWSFVPIANTPRKQYYGQQLLVTESFPYKFEVLRGDGISRLNSASSSEHADTLPSSKEIAGPSLPPIQGTAKRLFLVRHGEVINPGERRGYIDVE